jgi:hypothetical protein
MTQIITYSLRSGAADSDEYYLTVAAFADDWLARIKPGLADLITGFRDHRRGNGEPDRSPDECAFELLALGVLVHEHGRQAAHMAGWQARLLWWLALARERYPRAEAFIKWLRGLISGIDADPGGGKNEEDILAQTIRWLKVNEESARERRLAEWEAYFRSNGALQTRQAVTRCLDLAGDFASTSRDVLGMYTGGVERFLSETAPRYRWRYDAGLVSRTRLEYHLGMLGTEILNRAYRQRFLSSRKKVAIVPPCMRVQPDEECKALATPFGAKCQACTPTCRVHQVTKLGEKTGFEVFIIPDELHVFGSGTGDPSLGLVGVSCVLTNWSGGWEADEMNIPAQGILLDYVGCKYHWDKKGFPTETNLTKLQEVMGVSE